MLVVVCYTSKYGISSRLVFILIFIWILSVLPCRMTLSVLEFEGEDELLDISYFKIFDLS